MKLILIFLKYYSFTLPFFKGILNKKNIILIRNKDSVINVFKIKTKYWICHFSSSFNSDPEAQVFF